MPSSSKDQFYNIKSISNQFENDGPRTNNHAEAHNSALNKAIGSKPNFFSVVKALKVCENYNVWKWLANKGGNPWSKPRRRINVRRDIVFHQHKSKYTSGQIDLFTFIRSVSYMFDLSSNNKQIDDKSDENPHRIFKLNQLELFK